jgi:hypothetical protein
MPEASAAGKPGTNGTAAAVEWSAHAGELAAWAWARLVNRADVWGRYGSEGTFTAPAVTSRGKVFLTEADVTRHFRPARRGDILGLHTTSPDNLSRWLAVDIDQHGPGGNDSDATLAAALAWHRRAQDLGFRPLLTSSNGAGGYHLRVIFREPIPTPRAFSFARWLVRDYGRFGLPAVETFPKQPRIKPGGYGNWLRLPGKHHKRPHWSEAWDGARWLDGAAAVAWLLSVEGDNPGLIPRDAEPRPLPQKRTRFLRVPAGDLEQRIARYVARVPNLGEGQGRDDNGFRLACWLVRDLALSDEQARPWLEHWDAGNTPPKGEAEVSKWLASARAYGRREYGCGLGPEGRRPS